MSTDHNEDLHRAIRICIFRDAKLALAAGADPGFKVGLDLSDTTCELTLLEFAVLRYPKPQYILPLAIVRLIAKAASQTVLLGARKHVLMEIIEVCNELVAVVDKESLPAYSLELQKSELENVLVVLESIQKKGESKHFKFGGLLFSEQFSDFKFVFPEDKATLHAHKTILASVSPVFNSQFSGKWKNEDEVQPDHSLPVMKAVLSFIYTTSTDSVDTLLEEDMQVLGDVLKAADYYELSTLTNHLSKYMKKSLSLKNLKEYLLASGRYGLDRLKSACFSMVRNNKDKAYFGDPEESIASIATLSTEHPDLWQELSRSIQSPANKRRRTD